LFHNTHLLFYFSCIIPHVHKKTIPPAGSWNTQQLTVNGERTIIKKKKKGYEKDGLYDFPLSLYQGAPRDKYFAIITRSAPKASFRFAHSFDSKNR
jgi:hypothetical protein